MHAAISGVVAWPAIGDASPSQGQPFIAKFAGVFVCEPVLTWWRMLDGQVLSRELKSSS
jgi:hypothetical protein